MADTERIQADIGRTVAEARGVALALGKHARRVYAQKGEVVIDRPEVRRRASIEIDRQRGAVQ